MDNHNITLRPYQEECVRTVNELPDGSRTICALATGLGKSVIFSRFERKGRMLILSHRDELVRQPEKYFDCSFGIEKANEKSLPTDEVVSASVQSLSRPSRLKRFSPDDFDLIVVDEAHHCASINKTYRTILDYFHPRKLIGMTATPRRGDNVRLDDMFDDICYSATLDWGIKNGYLSNIKGIIHRVQGVSIADASMVAGDYNLSNLGEIFGRNDLMFTGALKAFQTYVDLSKNHVLLYCIDVKSCITMKKLFDANYPKQKKKFQIITGDTPTEERHMIEQAYLDGTVRCIINCMVLTEGTDLPVTDRIIVLRPTVNPTLYTQIVGRGTRIADGKDYCLIVDVMPEKTKRICSIATLSGEDITMLPKKVREKLETEPIDLLKLDELVKTINDVAGHLEALEEEYDLLAEEVENEADIIKAAAKTPRAFGRKIVNAAYRLSDDIAPLPTNGIHYSLGYTSERRYHINVGKSFDAWISEPDVLGRVSVSVTQNKRNFRTDEPIPIDQAIGAIRRCLVKNYSMVSTAFYWSDDIMHSWEKIDASGAQKKYLCDLVDNLNEKKLRLSKYDASVSISYVRAAAEHCNELKEKRKKLDKLKEIDDRKQIPISYEPSEPFTKFSDMYPEICVSEPLDFTVMLRPNSFNTAGGATVRQKDFLESLLSRIKRVMNVDVPDKEILDLNRCSSVSAMIDVFKSILDSNIGSKLGPNACLLLSYNWNKIVHYDFTEPIICKFHIVYPNTVNEEEK